MVTNSIVVEAQVDTNGNISFSMPDGFANQWIIGTFNIIVSRRDITETWNETVERLRRESRPAPPNRQHPNLESLVDIDWASLGYPQIPELVHQLIAGDERLIVDTWDRLDKEVARSGVDWESFDLGYGISDVLKNNAQELLIPYLIEILSLDTVSDKAKDGILDVLITMIFYPQLRDKEGVYKEQAQRVVNAIWNGLDVYLDLLAHSNLQVRKSSYSLLLMFEGNKQSEVYDLICRRFQPIIESSD